MGHDGIHVAFDDHGAVLAYRLFGEVHCIQDSRFVKHRRARRVQVFRRGLLVQCPAAEPGDSGLPVPYWDHEATPEQVVIPAVVGFASQSGLGDQFARMSSLREVRQQPIIAGRAVAYLECLDGSFTDPAPFQVFADEPGFRSRQHLLEETARLIVDVK